jgi:hypothetical protein
MPLLPSLSKACISKAGALVVAALVSGCVHVDERSAASAGPEAQFACTRVPESNRWVRTQLFFGLSKPDGSLISAEDFQRFLDSEVTPRFRSGLTVLDGRGQFLSETGALVRESSKLLILFYPFDERTSASVEDIRKAYRTRFEQESVLRVDEAECVSF